MVRYFSDKEKQVKILESIDKLILVFPDFDYFRIHEYLKAIELDTEKRKKLSSITTEITNVLEKLKYIEHPPNGNAVYILTEKGRHFKYIKSLKPKKDCFKIASIILNVIFGTSAVIIAHLNYIKPTKEIQILK